MKQSFLLVAILLTIGCGGPEVKRVTGRILLDDQPAADANVTFWPHENLKLGIITGRNTDDEGLYDFTPNTERCEGYAGIYRVMVCRDDDLKTALVKAMAGVELGKKTIPPLYRKKELTPLRVEIQKGENHLDNLMLTSMP